MARPERQSELRLRRALGSSSVGRASHHTAVSARPGSGCRGGREAGRALWSWCSRRQADGPSERGPLQPGVTHRDRLHGRLSPPAGAPFSSSITPPGGEPALRGGRGPGPLPPSPPCEPGCWLLPALPSVSPLVHQELPGREAGGVALSSKGQCAPRPFSGSEEWGACLHSPPEWSLAPGSNMAGCLPPR